METKPENPLREIFLEAAELDDPGARAAFLEAACGNDTSLRQRVEVLLAAEAGAVQVIRFKHRHPVQS